MNGFWTGLWAELVDLLLPAVCGRCSCPIVATIGTTRALCSRCDAALPRLDPRLRAPASGALFACTAAAPFEGEVAEWIRRYKYPRPGLAGLDPAAEAIAGALLLEAAGVAPGPPDAVVPVPLHPARLRARGFDPAAGLARGLARRLGLAFAPDALERVRDTPSQTGLDRAGRRRNVAGAFRAPRAAPGPCLWLVDDVVTTGATLDEAARALRRAGARRVVGITAARTPAASDGEVCSRAGDGLHREAPRRQEPPMATLKQSIVLKHRANLGEEADEIEFQAGEELTVLKEWAHSVLCKNEAGQLFNVPKDQLEL